MGKKKRKSKKNKRRSAPSGASSPPKAQATTAAATTSPRSVMAGPSSITEVTATTTLSLWMPPALFGLPPVKDHWGLSDISMIKESSFESFRRAAARENSPEAAERAVFLELYQGDVMYEAKIFPWLFPSGTGTFAQDRREGVRFEEYVRHMLRLHPGTFRLDEMWLQFAVTVAAILRYSTGMHPIYKEEQEEKAGRTVELDASRVAMLGKFSKAFPMKSFCYRYLVGDEEFYNLAMIIMLQMTAEQRAEVYMKE